jgi:hypothetical protein
LSGGPEEVSWQKRNCEYQQDEALRLLDSGNVATYEPSFLSIQTFK